MKKVAKRRGYTYRVTDLDYPAISILDPKVALGAKIGSGKAFAFGKSVTAGVENLRKYYKNTIKKCPSTKWVLGGYSQGTLVIARAVSGISASKVVYVGLFGDPWTNLPEGKGILPSACFGKNLSKYRVYAPDCFTHTGTLGAKNPYVLSGYKNKYGLWCNDDDYFCGSSRSLLNTAGHAQYATKKEFIWMADIVERKLPLRTDNATAVMRSADIDDDEPEDIIQAHFPVDEYYVDKMGDVEFDASGSFSTGHEIVEYQ